MGKTCLNSASSRCHSIFNIRIVHLKVVKFAEIAQDIEVIGMDYTSYRTKRPVTSITSPATANIPAPDKSTIFLKIPTLELNLDKEIENKENALNAKINEHQLTEETVGDKSAG